MSKRGRAGSQTRSVPMVLTVPPEDFCLRPECKEVEGHSEGVFTFKLVFRGPDCRGEDTQGKRTQ